MAVLLFHGDAVVHRRATAAAAALLGVINKTKA
jgi:hypothetical protein